MALSCTSEQRPHILFVDAYDSFSENIIALLRQLLHATVYVVKIDEQISRCEKEGGSQSLDCFDAVVIGPGPGSPDSASDVGHLDQIWHTATNFEVPVLGICLGFQSLCSRYGLAVTQLDLPCHGHARKVLHSDEDIFQDTGEVIATNYDSLGVHIRQSDEIQANESSAASLDGISRPGSPGSTSTSSFQELDVEVRLSKHALKVLAWNEDEYVMAVKHTSLPFWGVQFHPESCLSNETCSTLLSNWWHRARRHNQGHRNAKETNCIHLQDTVSDVSPAHLMEGSALRHCLDELTEHCTREVSFRCLDFRDSLGRLAGICQALSTEEATVMLESSKRGRFSIYAFTDNKTWLLEQRSNACHLQRKGIVDCTLRANIESTMEVVETFMSQRLARGGDPSVPFWGGLVGFLSYEGGLDLAIPKHFSPLIGHYPRVVPDLSLLWVDRSVVLDKETGRTFIQSLRANDDAWLSDMTARMILLQNEPDPKTSSPSHPPTTTSNITLPSHASYLSQIRSCQAHLHAGNSYELCLTTSTTITRPDRYPSASHHLYRSLQSTNPSPYSAYLSVGATTIQSSSPEQFLSWSRSVPHLDMMPMKGTLAKSPDVTPHVAKGMLSTPKEQAENLMIADLIRHDLHRSLCPNGTVEVKSLYDLVETENTYQLISHIRGHMPVTDPSSTCSNDRQEHRYRQILHYGHKALRTSLPPGSMTGAPKIRSCSILSELEQRNRGVYSGIIGYFDVGGGGCWSVAIRCAFSHESEDQVVDGGKKEEVACWCWRCDHCAERRGERVGGDAGQDGRSAEGVRLRRWLILKSNLVVISAFGSRSTASHLCKASGFGLLKGSTRDNPCQTKLYDIHIANQLNRLVVWGARSNHGCTFHA